MSGIVSALGLTLLHFLWQGALIGGAAAAALRLSAQRTAQHRYLLCMVALLACAVTPAATAVVLLMDSPSISPLGSASSLLLPHIETPLLAVQSARGSWSLDLISATVAVWMIGVVSVIVYYCVQWRGVERIRRSAVPLSSRDRFAETAQRVLRRWRASAEVPLRMAASISTPIVIGLWRPMIVFPAAMIARMPVTDFELILLHEIAHIVRRDSWANALQICLEILFFYHPLVHWLSRRARLERERACDDFAIAASGSAYEYARALTSLMIVSGRVPVTALGAAGADLLPRLQYLTGQCKDHDEFPRSPLILALIALLLLAIGAADLPEPWTPSIDRRVEPVRLKWPLATADETARRDSLTESVADNSPNILSAPLATTTARRIKPQHTVAPGATRPSIASSRSEPILSPMELSLAAIEPPAVQQWALPPEISVTDPPPDNETELTATYSPVPEYPSLARLEGVEGTVSVVMRVAPDGRPADLQIVHAEPLGVFEGVVRRALMKWRYDVSGAAGSSAPLTTSYQLRFSINGGPSGAPPVCVITTASNTCQP
jgi:TonB family protein